MHYLQSENHFTNMRKGFTIWLTGYSGSGKTSIATELYRKLIERTIPCEILDGDVIRQHLSQGLTFSKEDRCENIMRIGYVAQILSKHGVGVIVSAISPYKSARDMVREKIHSFVEVYVNCSIEECERRDVKGLYKKAKTGEIKNFTGISDPYEEPVDPEVTCYTETESIDESVAKILACLEALHLIGHIKTGITG
nr:adenylyl-sulfate kinase [Niastella populi]